MTTPQTTASPEQKAAILDLIKKSSVARVANALGISREATSRLVAGLEVRAGTIALVAKNWQAAVRELESKK